MASKIFLSIGALLLLYALGQLLAVAPGAVGAHLQDGDAFASVFQQHVGTAVVAALMALGVAVILKLVIE